VPFAQHVVDFALATTESEVGVAWMSDDECSGGWASSLHFALLEGNLSLIASTKLGPSMDSLPPTPTLAATPTGWIVGFGNANSEINLMELGPDGKFLGDYAFGGTGPVLVQQPAGGPVVLWASAGDPGTLQGMILATAGAWTPVTLATNVSGTPSGVFVGDGFLVAAASPSAPAIQVLHFGLDGGVSPAAAIPAPEPGSPRLAYDGTTVRLTYAAGQMGTFWQRLTPDGTVIGSPVSIYGSGNVAGAFPIMAAGERTVVMQAPDTGSGVTKLSLEVLDGAGKPSVAAFDLNADPCATSASIAPLGGAAIVGWVGGRACHASDGGLTLARFVPPP
jgi:hypothetical protein